MEKPLQKQPELILEGVELVNLGSIMYGFLYLIFKILIVGFVVVQWTIQREMRKEKAEYGFNCGLIWSNFV